MKILAGIFIVLISLIQFRIWWGDGSYREIDQLKQKIEEQKTQNEQLMVQNAQLKKEIDALRNNPQVLEEKSRENLGLIKPGETFYRIVPKQNN